MWKIFYCKKFLFYFIKTFNDSLHQRNVIFRVSQTPRRGERGWSRSERAQKMP